ncbi:acetolactate synthase small subunit [Clostridia bacterium]|nr:acetolactate synthase small subunit [Clostridia bacterium]
MKHTLSVLVENKPGVLTRIAGLFARRGYNISSLAVGETDDPDVSRMTIVVSGDEVVIEQVCKQLNKLVDIIKLTDITDKEFIAREMIFIKVNCSDAKARMEILQFVDIFRARVVDIGKDTMIIEATGEAGKLDAIEDTLRPFGIRDFVRTGQIAMVRGIKNPKHNKKSH